MNVIYNYMVIPFCFCFFIFHFLGRIIFCYVLLNKQTLRYFYSVEKIVNKIAVLHRAKLKINCVYSTPSRQILDPKMSQGCPLPTYPERVLKMLFDHPGDVLIWGPMDVLDQISRDVPQRIFKRRSTVGCT